MFIHLASDKLYVLVSASGACLNDALSLLVKAWPMMHMWRGDGLFPQICIEMLCLIITGFYKSKLASVLIK